MKYNNIGIIGTQEEEESEQGIKNLFEEIMTEIFPDLVREKDTKIQEAQRVLNKLDLKRPTPMHIIIKRVRPKEKERIYKLKEKIR